MERRSEKRMLALLAAAGGLGIGLILYPRTRQAIRRVADEFTRDTERRLEQQLEQTSARLSSEAARITAEIIGELIPQFNEPAEEWERIYADLVKELERLPRK